MKMRLYLLTVAPNVMRRPDYRLGFVIAAKDPTDAREVVVSSLRYGAEGPQFWQSARLSVLTEIAHVTSQPRGIVLEGPIG